MDCIFCKIIAKEAPAHIVYEDAAAVAILDMRPRAPGHTMVLPRPHAATILEAERDALCPLFQAVRETVRLLSRTLAPDGFTIGINHGKVSGQVIEHLHVHIIPRYQGDGGGSLHSIVMNPPKESLDEVQKKIVP